MWSIPQTATRGTGSQRKHRGTSPKQQERKVGKDVKISLCCFYFFFFLLLITHITDSIKHDNGFSCDKATSANDP